MAQDVERKLAIEGRAVEQMRHQIIAIGLRVRGRLLLQVRGHAVVDVPIGIVDGDVADGVALLFE